MEEIKFKENIAFDTLNHMNLRGYAEDGSLGQGDRLILHGRMKGEFSDGRNLYQISLVEPNGEHVEAFLYDNHTEYLQDCSTLVTEMYERLVK